MTKNERRLLLVTSGLVAAHTRAQLDMLKSIEEKTGMVLSPESKEAFEDQHALLEELAELANLVESENDAVSGLLGGRHSKRSH